MFAEKDGQKLNLKDEGIAIEEVYVNGGFAEYQHDIGKTHYAKHNKNAFIT